MARTKLLNLSPEAMELINCLCDHSSLEENISNLEVAEDTLDDIAYAESDASESATVFAVAYNIKSLRKDLMKLKRLLTDEKED